MKIYHNPRCSKSRAGLQHLQEKGVDTEIIDYLKNPLSVNELKDLFKKLGKSPKEMIRTHEDLYKKEYKGKEFSDDEWIKLIAENPKLLHRPIIVKGNKAVWGQPVDEIDKLI
jgi:arsenate reductase (glutaredoxin)